MRIANLALSLAAALSVAESAPASGVQAAMQSLSLTPPDISLQDYNYTNTYGLSDSTLSELFKLHKFLVSTPSVSYSEYAVGRKLAGYLKSKGLTVELQQISTSRYNVFAYKGTQNETKVLLNSHIDTVPPFFPYSVSDDGTKIFGRGSADAKASVAAEIIAFLELQESFNEGDVALLFDVGEEDGADGIKFVEDNIDYKWNSLIVGEPTEGKLGVGHKGGFHGIVNVTGKASHSGYPELGIDANKILIEFLYRLNNKNLPANSLLGRSTLNIGIIDGGVAANVVSPFASASLGFRVTSDLDAFPKLVQETIDETPGGEHISFGSTSGSGPLFFDFEVEGFKSIVLGYGTDASKLLKNSIPHKFLYGPGSIQVAHGAGEYVYTDSLLGAVDGYKRLIKHTLSI